MKTIHSLLFVSIACAAAGCSMSYEPCETETAGADMRAEPCPDGNVCLDFELLEGTAVRAGRVAVMWYQVDEADPDPEPQIAWEGKLDPAAKRIAIPFSEIRTVADSALLLCERDCSDEARCPCRTEQTVGIATVVASDDLDGDGRTSVREVAKATFGRADVVIVRSEKEYPLAAPFDGIFASPIRQGTNAYVAIGGNGSGNVRLGSPEEGQAFHMELCSTADARCVPSLPKLRSLSVSR